MAQGSEECSGGENEMIEQKKKNERKNRLKANGKELKFNSIGDLLQLCKVLEKCPDWSATVALWFNDMNKRDRRKQRVRNSATLVKTRYSRTATKKGRNVFSLPRERYTCHLATISILNASKCSHIEYLIQDIFTCSPRLPELYLFIVYQYSCRHGFDLSNREETIVVQIESLCVIEPKKAYWLSKLRRKFLIFRNICRS